MKLDSYGIYFLGQAVMRQMPISYLIGTFRGQPVDWDREQSIRLKWIKTNYPDYYETVMSGNIDGSMLFLASSDLEDRGIINSHRASIWINGSRAGTAEYIQGQEYSRINAQIFHDMPWAERILLAEYPHFKSNLGKLTWIRRH